jgi:hypothetical protein
MIGHGDFAATPAGFVAALGTPIIATMFGFFWVQVANRFRRIEEGAELQSQALAETNRALAILIHDSETLETTAQSNSHRIGTLEIATAVLKTTIDNHEKWHERREPT